MDAVTAKALAQKLHAANRFVISAKHAVNAANAATYAASASAIIKEVIEALADMPDQTDYCGCGLRPAHREEN